MTLLNYMIWTGSPEIFTISLPFLSDITLRWYGLLFAGGFLLSQQLLYYIFKKEGKPEKDVDTLTIYMVIATVLGARLGHVIFYQPEMFVEDPLGIILPFKFSPFEFTGLQGLASHGAGIGIFIALWLYARKKLPNQNFLQTVDRIAIVVALTGAMIRFGNYFNSEIIGKPTESNYGVVFAHGAIYTLENQDNVEAVSFVKSDVEPNALGYKPAKIHVEFGPTENFKLDIHDVQENLETIFNNNQRVNEHIYQPGRADVQMDLSEDGTYTAIINTHVIPRHPAQLYESISCVFLFLFLLWMWNRYKVDLPQGRLFGIFLVVCFTLRFFYEFLKENQVDFESDMPLNMGQILSIPMVLMGLFFLWKSYQKPDAKKS